MPYGEESQFVESNIGFPKGVFMSTKHDIRQLCLPLLPRHATDTLHMLSNILQNTVTGDRDFAR